MKIERIDHSYMNEDYQQLIDLMDDYHAIMVEIYVDDDPRWKSILKL